MRKILVFLVVLFGCCQPVLHAQSAYQLVQTATRATFQLYPYGMVARHLRAPVLSKGLASQVARLTHPNSFKTYTQERICKTSAGTVLVPEIHIVTRFSSPILSNPSSLWGSYQYLRILAKLSHQPGAVNPRYEQQWKRIHQVTSYNGVHHIVNKTTLKELYMRMKEEAKQKHEPFTLQLDALMREAPAALHPFHGNPYYKTFFHNSDRQLQLYEQGGVRAIVVDYFQSVNRFHKKNPEQAPFISPQVMKNTLLEAKLWCETFHLKWK